MSVLASMLVVLTATATDSPGAADSAGAGTGSTVVTESTRVSESASAILRERLDEDRGWAAGTIQEQLDRDPTMVPFGFGAIFIPAMTNPLDEPPVTIWSGPTRVKEGTSGTRLVVYPGTYEVRLGTGATEQRLAIQATVHEQRITIVPPSWAGLVVHVVDEQFGSSRASYELIRVDDREYVGLGFGTDELAGEPTTTWVLRPGLYKIVRVGETYRARRDFSTVRLLEGQLTHFLLVVDPETGDFVGGGEVPEEELFRPRAGFFGSLVVGGDLTVSSRHGDPTVGDGLGFSFRSFADVRLSVEILDNPLVLQLQVEEGQTKVPALPLAKTNDRADLDALYVYQLTKGIGPYLRFGAETNLLPTRRTFTDLTSVRILDLDGRVLRDDQVDRLKINPAFGLATLKEGIGLNMRVLKTLFAETTVRSGLGARHRLARTNVFEEADVVGTPELEFRRIGSSHQLGIEGTLLAAGRLARWVLLNLELDALLPFDDLQSAILEAEGSVAFKLTSFLSVNYVVRFLRDREIRERDALSQELLLRFSLEVL